MALETAQAILSATANSPAQPEILFTNVIRQNITDALKKKFVIKFNLKAKELADLKSNYLTGLISERGGTAVSHPKLRTVQCWQLQQIFDKLLPEERVLMIGGGYASFRSMLKITNALPTKGHKLVYDSRRPRNTQRIERDRKLAEHDMNKGSLMPYSANVYNATINNMWTDMPNVSIVGDLDQIGASVYDVIIFIDSIYDYSIADVKKLKFKHSARRVISLHHTAWELKHSKSDVLPNVLFETKFHRAGGDIYMTFDDNSASYKHSWKTFKLWSQTNPVQYFTTCQLGTYIKHAHGYGSFEISFDNLTLWSMNQGLLNCNHELVECIDVLALMSGKWKTFWVVKAKLESGVEYLFSSETDPKKIMNWVRSHLTPVVIGPKVLDKEWNLLNKTTPEIIYFILLYTSLIKHETGEVLQFIGSVIKRKGLGDNAITMLGKRVRKFFNSILQKLGIKGADLLQLIRDMHKNTSIYAREQLKLRALALFNSKTNDANVGPTISTIWWIIKGTGFPDGIGGVQSDGLKLIKSQFERIKVDSTMSNNSASKLMQIINDNSLDTSYVINVGSSPGGLNKELKGKVISYVYKENEFEEFVDEDLFSSRYQYKIMSDISDINIPSDCTLVISDAGVRADFSYTSRNILNKLFLKFAEFRPKKALVKFMGLFDRHTYEFDSNYMPIRLSSAFDNIINLYDLKFIRTSYTHRLSSECYLLLSRRAMPLGINEPNHVVQLPEMFVKNNLFGPPAIVSARDKQISKLQRKFVFKFNKMDPIISAKIKAFQQLMELTNNLRNDWLSFHHYYEAKKIKLLNENILVKTGSILKKHIEQIDPRWFFYGRASSLSTGDVYQPKRVTKFVACDYIKTFHLHTNVERCFTAHLTWTEVAMKEKVLKQKTYVVDDVNTINGMDVYSKRSINIQVEEESVYYRLEQVGDSYQNYLRIKKDVKVKEMGLFRRFSYFDNSINSRRNIMSFLQIPALMQLDCSTRPKLTKEDMSDDLRMSVGLKKTSSAPGKISNKSSSSSTSTNSSSSSSTSPSTPPTPPNYHDDKDDPPPNATVVQQFNNNSMEQSSKSENTEKKEVNKNSNEEGIPYTKPGKQEVVAINVNDTSKHREEVTYEQTVGTTPYDQNDPSVVSGVKINQPIIRKSAIEKPVKKGVDPVDVFNPKTYPQVELFIKQNLKGAKYCDVPPDGNCVYYSISGIVYGMIEHWQKVQDITYEKLKVPRAPVQYQNLGKVCDYFGVSYVALRSDGSIIQADIKKSAGLLVAFETDRMAHCGIVVVRKSTNYGGGKIKPHKYVRPPVDLPIRTHLANSIRKEAISGKMAEDIKRFPAYLDTVKANAPEQFRKYIGEVKFVRTHFNIAFYNGCTGAGKSTAIKNLLKPYIIAAKASQTPSSRVVYVTTVSSNRAQTEAELTQELNLKGYKADTFIPIKTQHAIYDREKMKNERFTYEETELLVIDEGYKLMWEEVVVFSQRFPNAFIIIVGDVEQPVVDANKKASEGITGVHSIVDIFSEAFLKTPSEAVTVNDVSRRYGPAIIALVRFYTGFKYYCDNFRPMRFEFNPKVVGELRDPSRKEPTTTYHIAMENNTIGTCGDIANTVESSQGVSVDTILFFIAGNTVQNMRLHPKAGNVALTRQKHKMVIIGKDNHVSQLKAGFMAATQPFPFQPIKKAIGGLREGNLKRVQAIEPDFDPDFAREAAMLGFPLPSGPTPFKIEKQMKFKYTASASDFSLPLFQEFATENPKHYDNSREAMSYMPDWTFPMTVYHDSMKMYENDMVRLGYSFSGKQHFSASTLQEISTFMGRYEIAMERQKYQRMKLRGINIWELGGNAKDKFYDFWIDKEKFAANLRRKVFDDTLLKTWNDYAVVAKFDLADANMTMSGYRAMMRAHLKKQIKSKGFAKAMSNDMGQPISAAEKAVNLMFSCLFRFMSIMIKSSLKSNVAVADGMSDREVWEFVKQFAPEAVLMGDYPKYDATQSKDSHIIEAATWMLVCPDPELLKYYLSISRGRPVFSKNFFTVSAAQRDSGQVDTMCGNWLTSMIQMAFMLDDPEKVVYAVFKGDDSGIGLATKTFVLFGRFYDYFFPEPIKIQLHEEVLEFCNYLFDQKAYVYNPHIFMMKLFNKTYTEVTKTKENWLEYQESLYNVLLSYLEHPFEAERLCSKWTGCSSEYYNVMFQQIQAFAQLKYHKIVPAKYAKTVCKDELHLENVTVRDYGGLRDGNLKDATTPITMDGNKRTVIIRSNNKTFEATEENIKIHYNDAIQDGLRPVAFTYRIAGQSHCPTFIACISSGGIQVISESKPNKDQAEKNAMFKYFKVLSESPGPNSFVARAKEIANSDEPLTFYYNIGSKGAVLSNEKPTIEQVMDSLPFTNFSNYADFKMAAALKYDTLEKVKIYKFKAVTKAEKSVRYERAIWCLLIEELIRNKISVDVLDADLIYSSSDWNRFVTFREKMFKNVGLGGWLRDLTEEGIEPNPGWGKKKGANAKSKKGKQEEKKIVAKEVKKELKKKVAPKGTIKRSVVEMSHAINSKSALKMNSRAYTHTYRNKVIATAEQIAMSIACPENTEPIRLHGIDGDAPTALTKLKIMGDFKFATSTSVITINQCAVFLFRDMLRSMVIFVPNSSSWIYNCYYNFDYSANNSTAFALSNSIVFSVDQLNMEVAPKINSYRLGLGPPVHGSVCYTGKPADSELQFVWLGVQDTMNVNVSALGVGQEIQMCTYIWADGKFSAKNQTTINAVGPATIKSNTEAAGYYAWTVKSALGAGTATLSVSIQGSTDVWGHRSTPFVFNNLAAIEGYRQTAKGIRILNTTPQLTNDLQMTAVQAAKGEYWSNYTNTGTGGNTIDIISNSKRSTDLVTGQRGYTGYLKPTEIADLTFKTGINSTNNVVQAVYYDLDAKTDFLAVAFTTSDPTKVNLKYNVFEFNEYKTMDQWREAYPSLLKVSVVQDALDIIRFATQHAENPNHWTAFWNSIKQTAQQVAKGVVTYGPQILKFAEAFA